MFTAIQTESLSIGYTDQLLFENLNLHIPRGEEISVLVSSNGCGKSTLLRSIARFRMECQVSKNPMFGTPHSIPFGHGRCVVPELRSATGA